MSAAVSEMSPRPAVLSSVERVGQVRRHRDNLDCGRQNSHGRVRVTRARSDAGRVGQSERRRPGARARIENQGVEFAGDCGRAPRKEVGARRARHEPVKPPPSASVPPAPVNSIGRLSELAIFGSAIVTEANGVSDCQGSVYCPAIVPDMTGGSARISAVAPAYGV